VKPDIDETDWSIIAADGVQKQVESFKLATKLCSNMAVASGTNYNVGDLVSFVRLSRLAEAQRQGAEKCKYPRLSEVTIQEDLGIEHATSVIAASGARKRARVDGSLNSAAKVDRADLLTMLFARDVLPACAISASALSHCCRGLRDARQKYMQEKRQAVADSVARWLNQPQLELVLKPHCVPRSGIHRTVACALDWLEKLPDASLLLADACTMGLAMCRLAVKFELKSECHPAALKILTSAQKQTLLYLEGLILTVSQSLTQKADRSP